MNKLGTVIGFTFLNKVRTKSFIVTTLVLALLVTIGLHVPYFIKAFSGGDDAPTKIGLVYTGQPELAESLKAYTEKQKESVNFSLVDYKQADEETFKKDLEAGKIDGYLQFASSKDEAFPTVTYTSKSASMGMGLQTSVQAALQSVKAEFITKGSLSDAQIAALNAPVQIDSVKAVPKADGNKSGDSGKESQKPSVINYVVVYILVILFFMTITMTGNMIAAEVTAEKSSRVMEILITSVSPLAQMFGKILGMFFIGLLQIFVFAGVVFINISLPYNKAVLADFQLDLSQLSIEVLIFGLVFYVLGYFLYATLFAAIGSLVSRTEELGQATVPVTMFSLVAFYIGIFSMQAPDSILMKVSSFIPFVSPVSMIVRVGMGNPPAWEIILSLLVLGASIVLFGWLSAKIYRTGVLLYGKRPTMKELRKAMKAYKI
ncbi:ABC transporter permease [Paenibacillus puldeungensis]|uniref:ABC transporter permease n=1 Tax=Paenibacillus puldeungensis TaxID=696536 RepID=A0ABW3RYJ0_9BACL